MTTQKPFPVTREQAITLFFKAIDHDDPYWTDTLDSVDESLLVFDDKQENVIDWPSQWDIGRALGFTEAEMEKATGVESGRLKELGL